MARVLNRCTKIDQGAGFVQRGGADVFNEVDAPVSLVVLLCNTEEETGCLLVFGNLIQGHG